MTGEPGERHPEQGENQQQTQPTYGTGPETNPGNIDGRRALSPLHQPWFPNYLPEPLFLLVLKIILYVAGI